MTFHRHHALALAGAAGLSGIALTDAVTHGLTGHYSVFADDSGQTALIVAGSIVHGLAYASFAWLLTKESGHFADANRLARVLRWVLIWTFVLLAAAFLILTPLVTVTSAGEGPLAAVSGLVALVSFAVMILGSVVLGISLWRNNPLGLGGRILGVLLAVIAVTAALAFLAPGWAHPGYIEATIAFGVALLGVRARTS